jgi:glycosyltransferase involved in cell wall biosynthesis
VQWLKKAIDAATFNSKQLSIQYHKFLGKPPVERIIYRGVDLSNYSAGINSKYKDGNKLTFLFIGGLPVYRNFLYKENTKGGHTLMNAWKEFEKGKYGNMEVKLIFAGPGSVKKISTDWHRNLKYPEKVEMPGILNKEELAKAYQQADIVIIPSMEEGLPNAGMEAAASGCALIGTNVGGIPEIIINGKTGILIEPGNEPQLVKAIETYISDPGMSARHGAQGRTLMQLFFKHDHFAPAYVQLYHELL